jgi:orotate phosphoribosyltransferase
VDASRPLEAVVADCLAALEAVRREQPWRARLRGLLSAVVQRGDFVLSSGRRSDFYIDGRLVLLTGEGAQLAGRLVAGAAQRHGASAVGGLVMGACPIVTASGIAACEAGSDLSVFYVRKQAKGHGKKQRVEGPALQPGQRVLVVDDVATSGGSLLETVQAVREDTDAQVVGALCLVDRLEGAREALAAQGLFLEALFTRLEV